MTVQITAQTHPTLFRAFLYIDYDSGAINRFEPEAKFYSIPAKFVPLIEKAEQQLLDLSEEDLKTFCAWW